MCVCVCVCVCVCACVCLCVCAFLFMFCMSFLTSNPLSPSPAGYHEGVVELCLCAATHVDEKDIALHHYKKGLPQDDTDSSKVYDKRLVLTCECSDGK